MSRKKQRWESLWTWNCQDFSRQNAQAIYTGARWALIWIQGSCSPEGAFRWQKGEQQIWRECPPHAHLNKNLCTFIARRDTSLVFFKIEARGQDSRTPNRSQVRETLLGVLPFGDAHGEHMRYQFLCRLMLWKDYDTGGLSGSPRKGLEPWPCRPSCTPGRSAS